MANDISVSGDGVLVTLDGKIPTVYGKDGVKYGFEDTLLTVYGDNNFSFTSELADLTLNGVAPADETEALATLAGIFPYTYAGGGGGGSVVVSEPLTGTGTAEDPLGLALSVTSPLGGAGTSESPLTLFIGDYTVDLSDGDFSFLIGIGNTNAIRITNANGGVNVLNMVTASVNDGKICIVINNDAVNAASYGSGTGAPFSLGSSTPITEIPAGAIHVFISAQTRWRGGALTAP